MLYFIDFYFMYLKVYYTWFVSLDRSGLEYVEETNRAAFNVLNGMGPTSMVTIL